MRKLIAILIAISVIISIFTACGTVKDANDKEGTLKPESTIKPDTSSQTDISKDQDINIGGLHLGDSMDDIEKVLGKNYKESVEELAYYGNVRIWEYENIAKLIIDKNSGQLMEIQAYSPELTTDMNVKVGDSAKTVFDLYRPKYEEYIGTNSGGEKLKGWFLVKENTLMLFDFDDDDAANTNSDPKPESRVESIRLTRTNYFD